MEKNIHLLQNRNLFSVIFTLRNTKIPHRFSEEEILSSFPHKHISNIQGETKYSQLSTLIHQLYSNSSTLPTTLGGGQNGQIGIFMNPTL